MRVMNEISMVLFLFLCASLPAISMPDSFYQAMGRLPTENIICVQNYDAGASFTESYRNFEHLEKETRITSLSYNTSHNQSDYTRGNASLEVHMSSNVIGEAHIAWQSKDPFLDQTGRHASYAQAREDLTGVFNIEKFVQLWSNSTLSSERQEWLPCR